ncbi:MAG: exosortase/archaeosortase family protein [Candidatus Omnitrophica bacterium]|nr:exosortase/archaeosortase family protein [Candidatus Omnitrophota bacterium]
MNSKLKTQNSKLFSLLAWSSLIGLLTYTYYPTFAWMVDRWMARDSYFAHGFLIPLVSLYWIFKKRGELASCDRVSEPYGLIVLIAGILIQVFANVFRIYFVSAFSFVIVLLGGVLFLFGKNVARATWFPIAFLCLMIPLPLLVISEVTLKMKFFVSEIATYFLNAIGLQTIRQGSYIYTPNSVVLVGDPCSGLRSFLAFLCLGFVFAYGSHIDMWKKAVLIAVGLPLAIVSNIGRVFAMGLLGELYGVGFISTKVIHDGGGILAFVIAFFCFMMIRRKLERIHVPKMG